MDQNSSKYTRIQQQVRVKPCKVGITCQSPLLKRLCSTLNLILQFRARQQTAHLQTILASMQGDALKSRVIVMLNSEQC